MDNIESVIKKLPDACGVYLFMSGQGKVIYVGKALSIIKRVRTHFRSPRGTKSGHFKQQVRDIDFVLTDTEEQALLLEASLIKENRPKYNVDLKDDKSYPYVVVTNDAFPRILIKRGNRDAGYRVFGPFTNVKLLRKALNMIRRIFPYCSCSSPGKTCLYYHLSLCPGPGFGQITEKDYRENIDNICRVLGGERRKLMESLQKKMAGHAREKEFEKAANTRDQLIALYALYSGRKQSSELMVLKEVLGLKKLPVNIEALDISCLGGKEATGSIVVFNRGVPDKTEYRRYSIKQDKGIDDVSMIREVVSRRYGRLLREKKRLPDLIVVDGGKGQVNAAEEELKALKLKITVLGIAKKNEEIWLPKAGKPVILERDSPGLRLIQRLRNEAHRFARGYHLFLRGRKLISGQGKRAGSKSRKGQNLL